MGRMSMSDVVILPKGKYFIGDPCYAIRDNWDEFCDESFKKDTMDSYKGTPMFCHGTAYGDGYFRGSDKKNYGVDAGIIGVVPMSLVTETDMNELKRLGTVKIFKEDFKCFYNQGMFFIGKIIINTN
jgi:hypothetical protein